MTTVLTHSLVDVARLTGVTPWEAFAAGVRIRTTDDVIAVARTAPPKTPAELADLARWCAEVASWSVERVAEEWRVSYATAVLLRDCIAGGAR
ncbi:MAG TPA: hypothetical protein VFX61_00015 [Micromonosporaceae bacterium]|nr:hypothetical protein [Micromonosporaceae bacterium]